MARYIWVQPTQSMETFLTVTQVPGLHSTKQLRELSLYLYTYFQAINAHPPDTSDWLHTIRSWTEM